MELSNRLQAVADMVSVGNVACDAGCDHGYVSIYLIQKGICPSVIAMDVNAGPLAQAKAHIDAFGLGRYIQTRLSDGVTALSAGEADSLILAGMGGRLVIKILTEGKEKISHMKELILQPQSEIEMVRAFLREIGYVISQENMVYEDGKYYPMMKTTRVSENEQVSGQTPYMPEMLRDDSQQSAQMALVPGMESGIAQTAYDRYGELLLKNRHPVLKQFLLWEQEKDAAVLEALECGAAKNTQRGQVRQEELKKAAEVREYALSYFGE